MPYAGQTALIHTLRAMNDLEVHATVAHWCRARNTVLALAKPKVTETTMEDMSMGMPPTNAAEAVPPSKLLPSAAPWQPPATEAATLNPVMAPWYPARKMVSLLNPRASP